MVNIDNVYQKVLSLANKEQRGYITPQEFNLYANQAQLSIFEQYFYDINQFGRVAGNENEYGDMLNLLNEKVSAFKTDSVFAWDATNLTWTLPVNLFRLGTVWFTPTTVITDRVEIQEVNTDELQDIIMSPLVTPTIKNPVYTQDANGLTVYPTTINFTNYATGVEASWVAFPTVPRWGYVVISEKAMFDPSTTTNFELHAAEETELVYKILKLAGVNLKAQEVVQVGQTLEQTQIQQEKK